jgi:hypothetical protein
MSAEYPYDHSLVRDRNIAEARGESAGQTLDFRQYALIELGFCWNWWLPLELASKWQTPAYPAQATPEAVQLWQLYLQEKAAANVIAAEAPHKRSKTFASNAQRLWDGIIQDLELLRRYDAQLVIHPSAVRQEDYPAESKATSDQNRDGDPISPKQQQGQTTAEEGPNKCATTDQVEFERNRQRVAEKRGSPIPKDEANIIVRNYLKANPDATARDVAANCGIALGRVPDMPAWKARLAQKQKMPAGTQPKASKQLTEKMLESIGQKNDPAAPMEAKEAAWRYLMEKAQTPEERARLNAMSKEEMAEAIRLVLGQVEDQEEQEKRRER